MHFNDLREFIDALQRRGELKTIDGANPQHEIGGVSRLAAESPQSPALLFDSMVGCAVGRRIVTNVLANKTRERLLFDIGDELSDRDALRSFKERLTRYRPIAPVKANHAPVLENCLTGGQIDLTALPWPRWHEGERNLCHRDALVISRDPVSGDSKIAPADCTLVDRDTLSAHLTGPEFRPNDKPAPIAISLGHEPALLAAAMIGSPDSNTDFGFAGWLRGAPVEIIPSAHSGLPIPAAGEVVLEGEMHPFDGTGATVKVRHMYLRSDAILLGNAPFLDATYGVLVSGTATLWNELERRGIANIAALNRRPWGVIILAIKQSGAGDVQRVASALVESSAGRNLRYAVIVDDDIDPYNLEKVFWAIATRYEAQRAVQIVRCLGDTEEGALGESADNNGHSAAIIDACRPFAWIDQFPRTTDISEALMQETVQKWGKVLERRA